MRAATMSDRTTEDVSFAVPNGPRPEGRKPFCSWSG
jgi:hypothetical protein